MWNKGSLLHLQPMPASFACGVLPSPFSRNCLSFSVSSYPSIHPSCFQGEQETLEVTDSPLSEWASVCCLSLLGASPVTYLTFSVIVLGTLVDILKSSRPS